MREVELEHAILGPELSLAGSFYWPDERFPTRAKVQLQGSLENIEAKLAADVAGIAAQAQAQITPFAAEKLRSLEARAGPIDLARFAPAVPHTALDVTLKATGIAGGAFAGTLSAANRAAGPLDAERLPVVRLETSFITDFTSARLQRAHAALHGGGSLAGDAELQAGHAAARLVASGVDLRSIHSRLRKTALSGPLQVRVDGDRQWARGSLTQEGIGLTAEVVRVGDTLEVRELRALAEGGEVSGTGRVRLESMAFDAKLAVKAFNPAALGDYPAGSLTGMLSAAGTLEPRRSRSRVGSRRQHALRARIPEQGNRARRWHARRPGRRRPAARRQPPERARCLRPAGRRARVHARSAAAGRARADRRLRCARAAP